MSAALDSVKERVDVPWRESFSKQISDSPKDAGVLSTEDPTESTDTADEADTPEDVSASSKESPSAPLRTLSWRNFESALKEITPSSSESLGTLADLRKWNQEFGEGRRERKRQVWGKDRFGFTVETLQQKGDSKVQIDVSAAPAASTATSSAISNTR